MNESVLRRLCRRYRNSSRYLDRNGHRHRVSSKTRLALLAAMGVPTSNPSELGGFLSQLEQADARRQLPPVKVVRQGPPELLIEIGFPAEQAAQRFSWVLLHEDGSRTSGQFSPRDLKEAEQSLSAGEIWRRYLLSLPDLPAPGYHQLQLFTCDPAGEVLASMSLIVVPETCYQPEAVAGGGRVWGPEVPLYALRSERNWGIGDFTDLIRVVEFAAQAGAGMVSLNPLHALFPQDPKRCNPYLPSTRTFLNVLYIDIEAVPDYAACREAQQRVADESFQAQLRALRATDLVDYQAVAKIKLEMLKLLYAHFRQQLAGDSERGKHFRQFQVEHGEQLRRYALHEALQDWLTERDPHLFGWPSWPEEYQQPESKAVAAFAAEHEERLDFYEYLQWQAQLQLDTVGQRAYEMGLWVGLCETLAAGDSARGAETWAHQHLYALTAGIGSTPDEQSQQVKELCLAPWRPEALEEQRYAPLISTLRRNMRSAGALCIDQIESLLRQFWITPQGGGYVEYPLEDMLGILALESQRNRCLLIGDNSGPCSARLRNGMKKFGIFSCRQLYSEMETDDKLKAPQNLEPRAMVMITNNEQPTLAGYWQGLDIELHEKLRLFSDSGQREKMIVERAEDRAFLLMALEEEGLLPAGLTVQQTSVSEMEADLAIAIYRYLARAPSQLLSIPMEDMLGQIVQCHLPGSEDRFPNWRHKLSLELELWHDNPRIRGFIEVLREERGNAVHPPRLVPATSPVTRQAVIPCSTYRLQLNREFSFDQALEVIPYLHQLGISHCYASPCLQARPGSSHGYDIVDHSSLNAELGGDAGFARLVETLNRYQMNLILDMVPNHMGIMGRDNCWWLDVLENGPASQYATFFDIDWTPRKSSLHGKVLVPVLGDHYGSILEQGKLRLSFAAERGAFSVYYYEHEFPIDPREYPRILAFNINRLEKSLGAENSILLEFKTLITAFGNLPPRHTTEEKFVTERARDKEVHKNSLASLYRDADISHFLTENLKGV